MSHVLTRADDHSVAHVLTRVNDHSVADDPRLLLHACCGPCAEYPARTLIAEGYQLQGYFFNPNIHPLAEWTRRRDNLLQLAAALGFSVTVDPAYDEGPWLAATEPVPQRCTMCYRVRLEAAAREAATRGIPRFTTTLLVSPYQDHEALRRVGHEMAERYGVAFLDRDFRPGFREGQDMARSDGLYRQKYCGCIRSLEESPFRKKILKNLANLENLASLDTK